MLDAALTSNELKNCFGSDRSKTPEDVDIMKLKENENNLVQELEQAKGILAEVEINN